MNEIYKNILKNIDTLKKAIDSKRPLNSKNLEKLKDYYRIGLTYSSNALEGNTLTESETKVLLEDGLTAGGKPLKDSYEAIGHSESYDFMFSLLKKKSLDQDDILTLHKLFYLKIDDKNAGNYRTEDVYISGSKFPVSDYKKIKTDMNDFMQWYNLSQCNYHPVEFAALAHKKFIFIHPFIDGNGRTARLLMNLTLLRNGYEVAVISPVIRQKYIDALEKAHYDDLDFKLIIAESVYETQLDMCRFIHIDVKSLNLKKRKLPVNDDYVGKSPKHR